MSDDIERILKDVTLPQELIDVLRQVVTGLCNIPNVVPREVKVMGDEDE